MVEIEILHHQDQHQAHLVLTQEDMEINQVVAENLIQHLQRQQELVDLQVEAEVPVDLQAKVAAVAAAAEAAS